MSTVLNSDFTRNVPLDCRKDDGTPDGLHYYGTNSDVPDLDGLKSDIKDGKATFPLSKGNYIIIVTNDSGKVTRSDKFTVAVDVVSGISLDTTDTYMNV